jgi:hypothetical protein
MGSGTYTRQSLVSFVAALLGTAILYLAFGDIAFAQDAAPPVCSAKVLENCTPNSGANGAQMRQQRLAEIQRHVLRISCRRCERTVEIQTADAIRLYGGNAVWKQVAQRLLDNMCQQRTGRHEEDGCWPSFEMP